MKVTKKCLRKLSKDSRNLSIFDGPEVRRSPVFDMKVPEERIEFAKMVARIGIELLYVYDVHRGRRNGLIRRLRGVTPSKLPEGQGD